MVITKVIAVEWVVVALVVLAATQLHGKECTMMCRNLTSTKEVEEASTETEAAVITMAAQPHQIRPWHPQPTHPLAQRMPVSLVLITAVAVGEAIVASTPTVARNNIGVRMRFLTCFPSAGKEVSLSRQQYRSLTTTFRPPRNIMHYNTRLSQTSTITNPKTTES